jgi:hypothetical protein
MDEGNGPDSYFGLSLNLDPNIAADVSAFTSWYGTQLSPGPGDWLGLPDYGSSYGLSMDPTTSYIGAPSPNLTDTSQLGLSWFQGWGGQPVLNIPNLPYIQQRGWNATEFIGDPVADAQIAGDPIEDAPP